MQVNSTSSGSNAAMLDLLNQQNRAVGKQTLDQADFFKLLTAQLAAQNPMEPMDDMSFISQMANFSSLQQMQTLSSNLSNFTRQQGLANASAYLGKTATVLDDAGAEVTGAVTSISVVTGTPMLTINGRSYGIDAVQNVTTTPTQTPTNDASTAGAQQAN